MNEHGTAREGVSWRESARGCGTAGRRAAAIAVLALAVVAAMPTLPGAAAEVVDSHVLRFEAMPAYVNLNMTTSIQVEIGTSYGAGLDNYLATATKPGGATASAWFNFTATGTVSRTYGRAGQDFAAIVDAAGTYNLRLDHFDGTSFVPAAYALLLATDQLTVTTEAALASNEYTDAHSCPVAQEFQRGSEIIARAFVRYASNGALLNSTLVPSSKGNVTGTLWGVTKNLGYDGKVGRGFWKAAFFIDWDETVGTFVFNVVAGDGRGNHGTGASPSVGIDAWRLVPAILKVVPRVENATGKDAVVFHAGDTIKIEARVTYEGHNQHNKAFPGPLNATRGGSVSAVLGYGTYNASSHQFATTLVALTLTHDAITENWTATYVVQASDPRRGDLSAVVFATDGATNPPNTGTSFTTEFAIVAPPSTTPPPTTKPSSTGFDPLLAGLLAVVTLVAGAGVGIALGRRRKGPSSRAKEPEGDPEDEWEVEGEESEETGEGGK